MWEWSWLCAQGASASTSWRFSSVVNETLPQCWGYPTARTFTGSHTPLSIYSRSLNCPAAYANARSGPAHIVSVESAADYQPPQRCVQTTPALSSAERG